VIERNEVSTMRLARRLVRRCGAVTLVFSIVLAATTAMTQQSAGTVTETIATRSDRDLNGREVVTGKVTTQRARTNNEERVVTETYMPSMEPGRLALDTRVERVTTVTDDESQTVEEIAERNHVSPSEPMRIVRRSVTTVRRSGMDTYVTERKSSNSTSVAGSYSSVRRLNRPRVSDVREQRRFA
jgi:hypothetical protein